MSADSVIRLKGLPSPAERRHPELGSVEPSELLASGDHEVGPPGSSRSFEDFLSEVERSVPGAGQLLLFSGDHLRLEVMLLRHEKNPRVIWGLKHHEDWAFKATLLRFARGNHPVHLILSTELDGTYQIRGWVVRRTMDAFWASPLPAEHALRFWNRCLAPFLSAEQGPA